MLSVYTLAIINQIDRKDEPFRKYLKRRNFIMSLMDSQDLPYSPQK